MILNLRNDQDFVRELTKIVEKNINNELFGVSDLAQKTGLSRSQIHRKLKSITNQSISQFIREVRLKKAKELLEQNRGTVSEIAYEVGFGSPSYFIKCFHENYGYAPGEYKKYSPEIAESIEKDKRRIRVYGKPLKLLTIALTGAVVIVTLLIVFSRDKKVPEEIGEKSIAVLPLKNSVADNETQILADGILEDILNRLSHIREITVKSRSSSEGYLHTPKTAPQIAAELGVSHLLEGTILREENNIRIYIQLIDAINDTHIWSAEYDKDLSGVFDFISDVSGQIAFELETVLSQAERDYIEKVYTRNTEAYELYQKGRFFWHRRTEQGLKKSVEYFNQALELEPDYSLAWAGLADSYLILTFWGWYPWDEGFQKTREYAMEAIRLDKNLAEPHVALGSMELFYNYNWKLAEKEYLKSVELNPNYSNGYLFYADYLRMLGKKEEARINMDKAIELYPNALINYHVSSGIYFNDGKFDEAWQETEKLQEIDKNFKPSHQVRFKINYHKGEYLKAIGDLHHYLLLDSPNESHREKLDEIYAEKGIKGVIYWFIEYTESQARKDLTIINHHFSIANLYGLLGDRESVLKHLRLGFEKGKSYGSCYIYGNYEFIFLHDDPEFIAFLKKAKIPIEGL